MTRTFLIFPAASFQKTTSKKKKAVSNNSGHHFTSHHVSQKAGHCTVETGEATNPAGDVPP
jgi:hypothetical protein